MKKTTINPSQKSGANADSELRGTTHRSLSNTTQKIMAISLFKNRRLSVRIIFSVISNGISAWPWR